jgi:hypothetical protein
MSLVSNQKKEIIVLRLTCKVSSHTKLVVYSYSTSNVVGITEQNKRVKKKSFITSIFHTHRVKKRLEATARQLNLQELILRHLERAKNSTSTQIHIS